MDALIFTYLVIFPFGKVLGALSDIIILGIAIVYLLKKRFKVENYLTICLFSILFSLTFFKPVEISVGIMYLVRLVAYVLFARVIFERFGRNFLGRKLIFNSLIAVGIFIVIFGWIQYFLFPDLRALKALGWDDHYFRLTSTFLDPAFTGILLTLTEILVLVKTIEKRSITKYIVNIFLMVTILFTYSRASYVAFGISTLILIWKFRKRFLLLLLFLFVVLIFFLPRTSGEGTNLARSYSIEQKFINYEESLKLISKSPVFGVGFNNLCVAKAKFLENQNRESHTCSGADNSILFIIATIGIVGLFIFTKLIVDIFRGTRTDIYGWGLFASFGAIFVHGMFTNTFFYNFILGWMALLVGISRKIGIKKPKD